MKFIYTLLFFGVASVLVMLFGIASTARSQSSTLSCAQRENIVARLADKYNERQVAGGVEAGGVRLIEIFASPGGSFTILLTYGNGISCVASSGKGWQTVGKITQR
jgi:hypothetical protein|tara:strand:- start:244 stop:561 length:318 start_codon:yes stop_codon:yes gene_type:complete